MSNQKSRRAKPEGEAFESRHLHAMLSTISNDAHAATYTSVESYRQHLLSAFGNTQLEGEAPQADLRMVIANLPLPKGSKERQHGFVDCKSAVLALLPAAQHAESGAQAVDALASCSTQEVAAFEKWAAEAKYDMATHPLHWLFLNERTYAARQGWKAALEFAHAALAAQSQGAQAAGYITEDAAGMLKAGRGVPVSVTMRSTGPWHVPIYFAAQQAAAPGALASFLNVTASQPQIDYSVVSAYADKHRLHFNGLCAMVREAAAPSATGTPEAPSDDALLLRTVVEHGMQLHFEGRGEDDAVWVDEWMKWSEGDRLGATRSLIAEVAKQRAAQLDGGQEGSDHA